jgi:phospholipase A-2-activating protein
MDVEYELSQQLTGHENQVRCVAVLNADTIVTGGLDAQVLMWQRPKGSAEKFALFKTLVHHSDWVSDLCPSAESPGSFYSASKDTTAFRIDAEGNPVRQFVGHEKHVCSVVERGAQIVTGSWDGTAKVWDANTGELLHTLETGTQFAVVVAVLPTGEILTGAQDANLRLFRGAECVKTVKAHGDIIRSISVSSTHLITASNDNSIKMWSLDLCEMGCLAGHQNYVYGVAHSADNQTLWSVGEDCLLKRWSLADASCKQDVLHAASVWKGTPMPNGDVITACEDKIVRIWTNDPSRMAPQAERETNQEMAQNAALQAASKGSSSTSMPDADDISKMPTTIGKKNGEIKCFKDGATVFAYSWNAGARQWDQVGEVTGSQESKKNYPGDFVFPAGEYDFVFDVELGSDRKALLPYNRGQNPMAVAEAFCARESLRKDLIDQIRKFIEANGGGGTTVSASGAPAAPKAAPAPPPTSTSMFPLSTPLQFKDAKYEPIQKKILEFNEQVAEHLKVQGLELGWFNDAVAKMRDMGLRAEFKQVEVEVIHLKLIEWPQQFLFPVMDLWRMFALHNRSTDFFKGSDRGAPVISKVCGFLADDAPDPLKMCTLRYLANLSAYQTNRMSCYQFRETIIKAVAPCLKSANKNIKLAAITVVLNFAIELHATSFPPKTWDAQNGSVLAQLAIGFLTTSGPEDGDAQQRAALTIGTLLVRDKEKDGAIAQACKEAGFLQNLVPITEKVTPRVVEELKRMLG